LECNPTSTDFIEARLDVQSLLESIKLARSVDYCRGEMSSSTIPPSIDPASVGGDPSFLQRQMRTLSKWVLTNRVWLSEQRWSKDVSPLTYVGAATCALLVGTGVGVGLGIRSSKKMAEAAAATSRHGMKTKPNIGLTGREHLTRTSLGAWEELTLEEQRAGKAMIAKAFLYGTALCVGTAGVSVYAFKWYYDIHTWKEFSALVRPKIQEMQPSGRYKHVGQAVEHTEAELLEQREIEQSIQAWARANLTGNEQKKGEASS
jgi:hypothetical protein